jgi:membrane protease YdiL (CAAX protease family)
VLVSSLFFAAAHLDNWLPINEDHMRSSFIRSFGPEMLKSYPQHWINYRDQAPIFWALQQTTGAAFFSLRVLSPLYQQRGLPALIGAHFAWNLGSLSFFTQVCARIFVRAVKYFRNRMRPCYEKPSR